MSSIKQTLESIPHFSARTKLFELVKAYTVLTGLEELDALLLSYDELQFKLAQAYGKLEGSLGLLTQNELAGLQEFSCRAMGEIPVALESDSDIQMSKTFFWEGTNWKCLETVGQERRPLLFKSFEEALVAFRSS